MWANFSASALNWSGGEWVEVVANEVFNARLS
jgi:hypothetical protein